MSIWGNTLVRWAVAITLAAVTFVLLLGGYGGHWAWTGFSSNDQLWDWLHLLLLPVALGTVPLWLQFAEHMSRARKVALFVLVLAFGGFVAAGYLMPMGWTGFSGNTLWDWLTLVILPVTVITIRTWPTTRREIRSTHIAVFGTLILAWVVTLIGGYSASWTWTGYPGNTLWDWLQLLLAPLVITTVLVPMAVKWVSGDAARLARDAERKKATLEERLDRTSAG